MPELRDIPMCDVDEPANAMRTQMDDVKLDELVDSIKRIGLQQPIKVRAKAGRYEIVFGHRRFMAHRQLGEHSIRAFVHGADEPIGVAHMFAENFMREDVNDADTALWMAQLVEESGYTEEMLIRETRKSADWIGDRFRLLRGDPEVFAALQRGDIKFIVARELNKCPSEKWRRFYLKEAVQLQASGKQVAVWLQHTPDDDAALSMPEVEQQHAAEVQSQAATSIPCVWCSEDYAQFNMDVVQVHKWCRVQMQQVLKQAESTA
jgi:ParB/RepB/Spo0J family partition protein